MDEESIIDNCSIEANIPGTERYKESNPYNYSDLDLQKRKIQLKAAKDMYPNLPDEWIAMAYDVITNKTEEEVNEIIETKAYENYERKERVLGGSSIGSVKIENNPRSRVEGD